MDKNRLEKFEKRVSRIKAFLIIVVGLMDILLSSISLHPTYRFIVYIILLVATGSAVPLVRMVKSHSHKVMAYIYMGFASYWVVGNAFNDPNLMFDNFLPILVLAIANAIAILISIVDGSKKGYVYASTGFVVILYNLLKAGDLSYVGGKPDIMVLTIALWTLLPMLWCHSLSKTASRTDFRVKRIIRSTFMSNLKTLPVYLTLGTIILSTQHSQIYEILAKGSLASDSHIIESLIPVSWFYILAHMTTIILAFFSNELVLHTYKIDKEITESGEIVYNHSMKVEAPVEDEDPYDRIIKDMKKFKKGFSACKIDRLVATQEMGKIRNEMDILTSKYHHGSREGAESLLDEIERDIEFAFRQ